MIAASIIYCVRQRLRLAPLWTKVAQNLSKYTESQLEECVNEL